MTGFKFAYTLSGSAPMVIDFPLAANTITAVGEIMNLESGYLDEGLTADTGLVGVALEVQDNTGGSAGDLSAKCIANPDAVYAVTDANARLAGATLDLATGALAVTTSSNTDLIVVAPSTATEDTLVMIIRTSHYLGAAV